MQLELVLREIRLFFFFFFLSDRGPRSIIGCLTLVHLRHRLQAVLFGRVSEQRIVMVVYSQKLNSHSCIGAKRTNSGRIERKCITMVRLNRELNQGKSERFDSYLAELIVVNRAHLNRVPLELKSFRSIFMKSRLTVLESTFNGSAFNSISQKNSLEINSYSRSVL